MEFDEVSQIANASLKPEDMLVIGLGGGGGNALTHMARAHPNGPKLVAVHTDARALQQGEAHQQVQIGETVTQGISTGGDPEAGLKAAESDETKLRAVFSGVKLCFLSVSLGGGTGTGSAPFAAGIAAEEGALVIAFASLPFAFEGEDRLRIALKGLAALREAADIVIVLPNDRLREVNPEQGSAAAFQQADVYVSGCIHALWHLLTRPSLIRLDFAHLKTMAKKSGGLCAFAQASAEGPERVSQLVQAILHSPYLAKGHVLSRAQGLLVAVQGGPDLTLAMIDRFMHNLRSVLPAGCRLHFGLTIDDALQDRMTVTVLASELWTELEDLTRHEIESAKPAETSAGPAKKTGTKSKKDKSKIVQTSLNLDPAGKGRFKDVEPTYHAGEDLDYPTFMRRGIKLSGSK